MTPVKLALLPDRGVVRVAGDDAEKLLQGIITNDMGLLASQPAIYAALLTPQGKILFEFFVAKAPGGFLLETGKDKTAELVKRLQMYRLRANVEIEDESADWAVIAAWDDLPAELPWMREVTSEDEDIPLLPGADRIIRLPDPRRGDLGERWIVPQVTKTQIQADSSDFSVVKESDYHAHRIALGVPEGGKDYVLGDAFPHEANLDRLNGVSFDKGCFVGQEVVSRMQHRGSARKRIVIVEGDGPLQPGSEITAGAAAIGTIGRSVAGSRALAMVRLDRAEEAKEKGVPLAAGGVRVEIRLPAYLKSAEVAGAA